MFKFLKYRIGVNFRFIIFSTSSGRSGARVFLFLLNNRSERSLDFLKLRIHRSSADTDKMVFSNKIRQIKLSRPALVWGI